MSIHTCKKVHVIVEFQQCVVEVDAAVPVLSWLEYDNEKAKNDIQSRPRAIPRIKEKCPSRVREERRV